MNTKVIIGISVITLGSTAFILLRKPAKAKRPPLMRKGAAGGKKRSDGRNVIIIPNTDNPFDMHYSANVKAYYPEKRIRELPQMEAERFAKILYEAKSTDWWRRHDREAIKGIFTSQISDKVALSNISGAFWNLYRLDLWQYLDAFLSDDEMHQMVTLPVKALENHLEN